LTQTVKLDRFAERSRVNSQTCDPSEKAGLHDGTPVRQPSPATKADKPLEKAQRQIGHAPSPFTSINFELDVRAIRLQRPYLANEISRHAKARNLSHRLQGQTTMVADGSVGAHLLGRKALIGGVGFRQYDPHGSRRKLSWAINEKRVCRMAVKSIMFEGFDTRRLVTMVYTINAVPNPVGLRA